MLFLLSHQLPQICGGSQALSDRHEYLARFLVVLLTL
jgi:hypothetical protein